MPEDRHTAVRLQAQQQTRNSLQGNNKKKRGKRIDMIEVGSFVTVAIPKEDRHRTDVKRLPGIVVEKKGDKKASFRIR